MIIDYLPKYRLAFVCGTLFWETGIECGCTLFSKKINKHFWNPQAVQDITRNHDVTPEEIVSLIFTRIDVNGEGEERTRAC